MAPPRIIFYGDYTASLSLYLDGLPPELAAGIAVRPPTTLRADLPILAGARLVVHVRGFATPLVGAVAKALDRLGVPRAWFTDDDLIALSADQPGFDAYTPAAVAAFAGRLVALIGTTAPLCARLAAFHRHVLLWPCVLDPTLLPPAAPPATASLRVAAFGGDFRAAGLARCVLPALAALPGAELVVTDALAPAAPGALALPFEPDFRRFVLRWRAFQPAILVHPPGATANLPAKGPGSLLAALYIGAVPVVADEPAFAGLGLAEGVVQAGPDPAGWHAALASLAAPETRLRLRAALLRHCQASYTPAPAAAAIAVLHRLAPPAAGRARWRVRAARLLLAQYRWRQWLGRRLSHWRGGHSR